MYFSANHSDSDLEEWIDDEEPIASLAKQKHADLLSTITEALMHAS